MTSVQCLPQVERLAAADLAHDDAVWARVQGVGKVA